MPALLADLEDLRSRLRDADCPQEVVGHVVQAEVALRLVIMRRPDSVPPLAENQRKRSETDQAFRNASKLMKGLLK